MARSSIIGYEQFRQHMKGLEGSYVLIGGIACDILLSEEDLPFRATHDFDMVLVANAKLPKTAQAVWSLVREGGYRCGWGGSENVCFYRFTEPSDSNYPRMIEIFGTTPDFLAGTENLRIAPLHINDEISSLSAIMLDDSYYELLLKGISTVDGLSVLRPSHLIPFKAKAFLDLQTRKKHGEQVDSKAIRKHKNDAIRLSQLLTGNERVSLSKSITNDMNAFIDACEANPVDTKTLGLIGISMNEILDILKSIYSN